MMGSAPRPHTGVMEPTKLAITTARTGPPESQESARSDQFPMVRAPARRAATATTGSSASSPWATVINIRVSAPGSSEPAVSSAAIRSPDPVVFFEYKAMYVHEGGVPDDDYVIPFGVADVKRARLVPLLTLHLAPCLASGLAPTCVLGFAPGRSIAVRRDCGPTLVRQPGLLRRRRRSVGHGHFQKTCCQEGFQPPLEMTRSAGMANGCRQCFGRNGTAEARSKHGDLSRRQRSLALLAPRLALLAPYMAPDLALDMARLSSRLAPGLDHHSVSRRPSTGRCYRRAHRLPGYLSRNGYPANRDHEAIGDGELGFRQVGLDTAPNHVQGSRSHPFDVLGQVQRFRQQGIAGHRAVCFTQLLQRERRRKAAVRCSAPRSGSSRPCGTRPRAPSRSRP